MPDTKDTQQPRTYRVTRRQMKEIWEACAAENRPTIIRLIEQWFTPFESEIPIDYNKMFSILSCFNQKEPEILKKLFPEYFFIPEGEPVLVRDYDETDWHIRISDGEGGCYVNGGLKGLSITPKQIIPYTKQPPK